MNVTLLYTKTRIRDCCLGRSVTRGWAGVLVPTLVLYKNRPGVRASIKKGEGKTPKNFRASRDSTLFPILP